MRRRERPGAGAVVTWARLVAPVGLMGPMGIVLCCWVVPARVHAQPGAPAAPDAAPAPAPAPGALADELGRLQGQRVRLLAGGAGYVIEDVAGEGAPVVGVVERRGEALWLVAADGVAYRLAGALAKPRIAGPGYKIWALGAVTSQGGERVLVARRLGVLAPPWRGGSV
jgi:hypothetical protein